MTNVRFQRSEFEKHIKLDEKILEKISLLGTPLENADKNEIEIEVFPNRPDLISLEGFVRALKSFLGKDTGLKKYKLKKPEKDEKVVIDKEVKTIRPYTVCAIAKNLSLDNARIKSIIDLQEKLHITLGRNRKKAAIGIYPLEKIRLPIRYTALKPGEIRFAPLDSGEMTASQILKKHPAGKKYSDLLKGCQKYPVFLDADSKILSMPPIINSSETGRITEETKSAFIECSGHDLELLKKTLNIIITTLADMGASIHQMSIQDSKPIVTPDLSPEKTRISIENINKLLGLHLNQKDISVLLEKMGHELKYPYVYSPAWRTDILHEVDIAEDIAIAYGYDKFKSEIPNIPTSAEELKTEKIKARIAEILIGLNMNEISTYHLIKSEEAKLMKVEKPLEILDSKTDYKILRPNLFIPALRILSENVDTEYPQKIFEIGPVFHAKEKSETGIKENDSLLIGITPGNFTDAKQHLDYLFSSLGLDYQLKEKVRHGLIEGRTGEIIMNDKPIGYLGEVHPLTLNKSGLKMPLAVVEISLQEIYDLI
ncbi:phenylalanine--tRNA ligase subunit beta [Candidatus Pacearchaeota archaeon CG_4_9_14_0_2_um_filter_39_13]|nr:phenylalanine--tRNA ligase subunit beta [Candidatus Pacearchaeota archaeon]OIO42463.1 MAG: phenylalanine--tRNA ligase subunit beta [Candidatus Pacearchaeota archaeon CG1_02_39_14]PJC44836.1 MAG: phenylalanine--tRNA ligase subunit beta [Candidatus Pacearchaeota archaeon CG_4_9_14_0_2_um_filter_39_13]